MGYRPHIPVPSGLRIFILAGATFQPRNLDWMWYMAGFVGVLGFNYLDWNVATGLAVCLLGGFIGSGLFRFNEDPRDREEMYRDALRDKGRRAIKQD